MRFSGLLGTPHGVGKIKKPEKFDNVFFGIHRKMTESLDALTRLSLERSIEAIVDAGKAIVYMTVYFSRVVECVKCLL